VVGVYLLGVLRLVGLLCGFGGVFGDFRASEGVADGGFVWASKREPEKWHTETRSNLADFCLARSQILGREGLV